VTPVNAFVNGYWVSVEDVFGSDGYERLADKIAEERA